MSSPQPRAERATHLPPWLATRVLDLLPMQDAMLLAAVLSDLDRSVSIAYVRGGWRVVPLQR
jgi:hypothetical protein